MPTKLPLKRIIPPPQEYVFDPLNPPPVYNGRLYHRWCMDKKAYKLTQKRVRWEDYVFDPSNPPPTYEGKMYAKWCMDMKDHNQRAKDECSHLTGREPEPTDPTLHAAWVRAKKRGGAKNPSRVVTDEALVALVRWAANQSDLDYITDLCDNDPINLLGMDDVQEIIRGQS